MTEDDTFKVLRRPTHAEMGELYYSWGRENENVHYEPWINEREELFATHGWNVKEWLTIKYRTYSEFN